MLKDKGLPCFGLWNFGLTSVAIQAALSYAADLAEKRVIPLPTG